jgi:hypothetical protein
MEAGMKKSYFVASIITLTIFLQTKIISQTQIFVEHFNYSAGSLPLMSDSVWTHHSGNDAEVNVIDTESDTSGSLRYNDEYNWYFNPSEGNRIELTQSETEDVGRNFGALYNSDTVYASFLLKVITPPSSTTGTYFLHFFGGISGTDFGACVWIKRGSTNSYFRLGTSKRSSRDSNPGLWYEVDLNPNQTYLIIVAYVFVDGVGNDSTLLWINPEPIQLNNIPPPLLITGEGTDLLITSGIQRLGLRQNTGIGTLEIDEIRVATSWNLAPLPVELSSFTAKILKGGGIQLNWCTETEVNNYGFDIERSVINPKSEIRNPQFEMIGFVQGHGNSNSPKDYSFIDNVIGGKYSYRLKQIDTDGQFEYSKIIEVDAGQIPGGFVLGQNYPNPFNPSTTIKFALAENQLAVLKVYDVIGNQIAVLFDGLAESNKVYEKKFDATNLSSGIYFYRLEASGKFEIKKMLLLK